MLPTLTFYIIPQYTPKLWTLDCSFTNHRGSCCIALFLKCIHLSQNLLSTLCLFLCMLISIYPLFFSIVNRFPFCHLSYKIQIGRLLNPQGKVPREIGKSHAKSLTSQHIVRCQQTSRVSWWVVRAQARSEQLPSLGEQDWSPEAKPRWQLEMVAQK